MTASGILAIVSRKDAKVQGLTRYFTGVPCIYGHIAERTIKGICTECNRIRANDFYHANKEKVQALAKARYIASQDKRRTYSKQWAKENPEHVKVRSAAYYQANKEKIKQRSRDWGSENAKRKQVRNAAWNAANPE
jgi:hypothetical protein